MQGLAIQFREVQDLHSILHSQTCAFLAISESGFLQKVTIMFVYVVKYFSSCADLFVTRPALPLPLLLDTEGLNLPSVSKDFWSMHFIFLAVGRLGSCTFVKESQPR